MNFDEIEIQKLFGHEAAEDEDPKRLKQYYFKSKIYGQVVNDLPLRIVVGHKGIGKSALFKVAIDEESENGRLTILIKPDDIIGIGSDTTDFLELIREWKIGINQIVVRKVLTKFNYLSDDWKSKLSQCGGAALEFLNSVLKIDGRDFDESKKAILRNFLENNKISVYIDDLDRGWEGKKQDIQRISALLNAVRDVSTENRGIYFRVSLRSDVYYLARTSDESTDKTESSVIWYTWTNHEILVVLVKRIESYYGREVNEEELLNKQQSHLMSYLSSVIEERFTGVGHWQDAPMYRVLMSLVRKRPRDLVKLLTLAARKAHSSGLQKITTDALESSFEEYSQGRLQDTINEYRSELPQIEKLILGMRPTRTQMKEGHGYIYKTDELLKKLRDIEEQGKYLWASKKTVETRELAGFLYKINFITARKDLGAKIGIDRKYFEENRYLSNAFVEFGYDWEVHPAYRWALHSEDKRKIFEELELNSG